MTKSGKSVEMVGEVDGTYQTLRPLLKMNPEEGVKSFHSLVAFFFMRASIALRRLAGIPLSLPERDRFSERALAQSGWQTYILVFANFAPSSKDFRQSSGKTARRLSRRSSGSK